MNARDKKLKFTKCVKYLLDAMFYLGIIITITIPVSIKWLALFDPRWGQYYVASIIIFFILGIAALFILWELRCIFKTVLEENCFVEANVKSLRRMGNWSFFIVVMSLVRLAVFQTAAMMVIVLVFVIAGLFSKVLAMVFDEAIRYKEENDLTI